jgi:hypothetical protein
LLGGPIEPKPNFLLRTCVERQRAKMITSGDEKPPSPPFLFSRSSPLLFSPPLVSPPFVSRFLLESRPQSQKRPFLVPPSPLFPPFLLLSFFLVAYFASFRSLGCLVPCRGRHGRLGHGVLVVGTGIVIRYRSALFRETSQECLFL